MRTILTPQEARRKGFCQIGREESDKGIIRSRIADLKRVQPNYEFVIVKDWFGYNTRLYCVYGRQV